jgi:hypothetical protein
MEHAWISCLSVDEQNRKDRIGRCSQSHRFDMAWCGFEQTWWFSYACPSPVMRIAATWSISSDNDTRHGVIELSRPWNEFCFPFQVLPTLYLVWCSAPTFVISKRCCRSTSCKPPVDRVSPHEIDTSYVCSTPLTLHVAGCRHTLLLLLSSRNEQYTKQEPTQKPWTIR